MELVLPVGIVPTPHDIATWQIWTSLQKKKKKKKKKEEKNAVQTKVEPDRMELWGLYVFWLFQ